MVDHIVTKDIEFEAFDYMLSKIHNTLHICLFKEALARDGQMTSQRLL